MSLLDICLNLWDKSKFGWYFRLLNDTEIAKAKRDFELKKAAYDVEVQTKVNDLQIFGRKIKQDQFWKSGFFVYRKQKQN